MTANLRAILPLKLKTPKGQPALVTDEKAYEFMVGHILGDAYLSNKGYLQVDQASKHLSGWFHVLLASYGMLPAGSVLQETTREDKQDKPPTISTSWRYCTKTYDLTNWIERFYKKKPGSGQKSKTVPKNINQLLVRPFSLAVWFLGDGWFDGTNVCFAAGSLDDAECGLLRVCLEQNFGLQTTLVSLDPTKNNGRAWHRITVSVVSYKQFKGLVKPYLDELETYMGGPGSFQKDQYLKRKFLP